MKEAGSIAEASLKLSGIFEVAQSACDEYMKNVTDNCIKIEKQAQKEAKALRKKMIETTEIKCRKIEQKSEDYLKQLEEEINKLEEKKTTKEFKGTTPGTKITRKKR